MRFPQPPTKLTEAQLARVTDLAAKAIAAHPRDLEARDWYFEAHEWIEDLANQTKFPTKALAFALAAISPRNRWERNKVDLVELIDTGWCGAIGHFVGQAKQILAGADPMTVLGGPKVRAFGHNLAYPEHSTAVTLDYRMVKAMGLPSHKYLERVGVYDAAAQGLAKVAADEGMMPHELQAAVWVVTT